MNLTATPEVRTARKSHRCDWCGEGIGPGATYENTFIVWDGTAWRRKLHAECADAERAFDYQGDDLQYPCSFQRGHTHEWNYYSVADGVKDGCPGCIKQAAMEKTK